MGSVGWCIVSRLLVAQKMGYEQYGGSIYRLNLEKEDCTCNIPQLMHALCSHTIKACQARGLDHISATYVPTFTNVTT